MSTRQSSRLKTMHNEESAEDESDGLRAGPGATTNAKKRKRTAINKSGGSTPVVTAPGENEGSARPVKSKPRGKRGFLHRIAEMPLELLFEVSS